MRRNPDDPFDDIFREIERMMNEVMNFGQGVDLGVSPGTDTHVTINEYEDEIQVVADLPGVEKDDINLQCDGQILSIRAASGSRDYDERIQLPATVDEQSAKARYNNGVLEVTFERADESANISVE